MNLQRVELPRTSGSHIHARRFPRRFHCRLVDNAQRVARVQLRLRIYMRVLVCLFTASGCRVVHADAVEKSLGGQNLKIAHTYTLYVQDPVYEREKKAPVFCLVLFLRNYLVCWAIRSL